MSWDVPPSSAKQAFSLVELAIVLVILGLLVGGVLAGKSLIHASQLRTVSTQHANYLTAFLSFRDKYLALPGDIPNATQFWGAHDPDHSTCLTASGTGTDTLTCNGNGDGNVDGVGSWEMYRAWNHLSNARLIEGSYTGTGWGGGSVDVD
jgi:prepilin-type N-terminal cleavage/methylation domain-containing protein